MAGPTTRKPRRYPVARFRGYKTELEERIEVREGLALRERANEKDHLDIYGGQNKQ